MPAWQEFLVRQAIYLVVPLVAKQLAPYLTTEAKSEAVAQLRALDKKTSTVWDDVVVEALAQAWGVK